ncbi:hypothetical protein OQA88_2653 [Cercophora sp. LCS_1]
MATSSTTSRVQALAQPRARVAAIEQARRDRRLCRLIAHQRFTAGGNRPEAVSNMARSSKKPEPAKRIAGARRKATRAAAIPTRYQPFRNCAIRPQRFNFFMNLPAEIRVAIYKILFIHHDAIDVADIWNAPPKFSPVGLLRANKQIHSEAAAVLYRDNTFSFLERCDDFNTDHNDLNANNCIRWLRDIGTKNAASLRNLQLRVREERDVAYYVEMLREIAAKAKNITSFALIAERHASQRLMLSPGNFMSRWEPNQIEPLSLSMFFKLKPSLSNLELKRVVLSGTYKTEELDKICLLLNCRLQVVCSKTGERGEISVIFWDKNKYYDAMPTSDGLAVVNKLPIEEDDTESKEAEEVKEDEEVEEDADDSGIAV